MITWYTIKRFPEFVAITRNDEPWKGGNTNYKTVEAALTAVAHFEGKFTDDRDFRVFIETPFPEKMPVDHGQAENIINRKLKKGLL